MWTIMHHNEEEKLNIFSKFGQAGLEPTHVPGIGLPCKKSLDFKGLYFSIISVFRRRFIPKSSISYTSCRLWISFSQKAKIEKIFETKL